MRRALSRALLAQLAPILAPLIGTRATREVITALARASVRQMIGTRRQFLELARQQYESVVSDPIPLPALREYDADAWAAALSSALPDDRPVEPDDVDKALMAADLQARNAERDALVAYSLHDEQIVGWARVDHEPGTCPWCRMLISRGPVYSSARTAGGRSDFHRGDTCSVILVTESTKDSYPGIEHTRDEQQRWANATGGRRGRDAINAFRRAVEADNRHHTGATKRTATELVPDKTDTAASARRQLAALDRMTPTSSAARDYRDTRAAALRAQIAALEPVN